MRGLARKRGKHPAAEGPCQGLRQPRSGIPSFPRNTAGADRSRLQLQDVGLDELPGLQEVAASNQLPEFLPIDGQQAVPERGPLHRIGIRTFGLRILPPELGQRFGRLTLPRPCDAQVEVCLRRAGLQPHGPGKVLDRFVQPALVELLLDLLNYLLDAVRVIVESRGRKVILLVVIGRGTEFQEIRKYATDLGVERYVRFTGRIPDEDLIAYLSTADVCVNPDVANEMNDKSTMNKIMEYMALGKPIVQFDLTEGRRSALDASLYARKNDAEDFADRILELLNDPARAEAMGKYGKDRVENCLAWEFSERVLREAYASLFSADGVMDTDAGRVSRSDRSDQKG